MPCTGLAPYQHSGWVTLRDSSPAAGIRDAKAITGLCKPHLHKSQAGYKKPSVLPTADVPKVGKDKRRLCLLDKSVAIKKKQHFRGEIFGSVFFFFLLFRHIPPCVTLRIKTLERSTNHHLFFKYHVSLTQKVNKQLKAFNELNCYDMVQMMRQTGLFFDEGMNMMTINGRVHILYNKGTGFKTSFCFTSMISSASPDGCCQTASGLVGHKAPCQSALGSWEI